MSGQVIKHRVLVIGFILANVLVGFQWQWQPNIFLLLVVAYVLSRGHHVRLALPWLIGVWHSGLTEGLFGYYSLCYVAVMLMIILYHERLLMYWMWQQCVWILGISFLIGWGADGTLSWPLLGSSLSTAMLWWLYEMVQRVMRLRQPVMSL